MDMDTATRGQRAFLGVVGFIYASFGFSLSVITALYNLLFHHSSAQHEFILMLPSHPKPTHHHHAHHHGTHARPRRLVQSTSEHSIKSAPQAPEPLPSGQRSQASSSEKTLVPSRKHLAAESNSLKSIHSVLETTANGKSPEPFSQKEKRSLSTVHGRSRSESTPTIMVGHHDSTEHVSWKMPDTLTEEPAQMSTPSLLLPESQSALPPPSAQTASTVKSNSCAWSAMKAKPRLFDPKTWGNHKRLKRCQSSPQLCEPVGVPFASSPPRKSPGSDSESPPPQDLKKNKTWKHLRKAKSGPFDEKAVSKADRKSDKKPSQTLRTHPYEAPYFAPPPVPTVPVHITLVPDHTSSDYASSIDSTKSSPGKKSSKPLTKT